MATATRKSPAPLSPSSGAPGGRTLAARVLGLCEAVYRFLASLKLAVLSLGTLAAVLAYATFFESWYGTAAVQDWIYQSRGFAILLAFLGANIFCAALIRYPWKARQTGFVITHAGLLIVLAGSWISLKRGEEGQVAALEGEVKSQMMRTEYPVMRVRVPGDPHSSEVREYELPFRPGTFAWGPETPRSGGIVGNVTSLLTSGRMEPKGAEPELVTRPNDPFKLAVKAFLPASIPAQVHEAAPDGVPMVRIRPRFKGPQMPQAMDVFETDRQSWFRTDRRFFRTAKGGDEVPARFVFSFVDRPELVGDFLTPPKASGLAGAARFRYRDREGKTRVYDWDLEGQDGKSVTLPDSDLTVTLDKQGLLPLGEYRDLSQSLGESSVPVASFLIKQGSGPEVAHHAMGNLPMIPSLIPGHQHADGGAEASKPLAEIGYFTPPVIDPKTNGLFGQIEVLGSSGGALYYRVFGRGEKGVGQLRDSGRVKLGREITAFGNNPNMPMTLTFEVDRFLPSGRARETCEPLDLPKGQMSGGIPAVLVEMIVDGKSREFWVRRSASFDQNWEPAPFPDGNYEVCFDFDRKELGFDVQLDDFQVGFDPGSEQASSYVSKVRLTDKAERINERPITISMNEPMTHRGYTFYQSNYIRHVDPRTGQETGQFMSVFQVARDPGRPIKYGGCLLVVVGAFVQFYMRAGLFTDGGKRERERALARTAKGLNPKGGPVQTIDAAEGEDVVEL